MDTYLVEEIEHFFVSYHELDGETFKPIARLGPEKARKIIDKGLLGKPLTSAASAKAKRKVKS